MPSNHTIDTLYDNPLIDDIYTGNKTMNGTSGEPDYLANVYRILDFPAYLAFPIYGILCPIIAILTLISNTMVVCVFMTKRMRSVTTIFLAGLAGSDTLSACLWSIVHLYFYGIRGNTSAPVSYPLCKFHDFCLYLAVIFHATSVWLTMTLGIQRCSIVVHPFRGPRIWTIRNSVIIAVLTYLVPLLVFLPLFFMSNYYPYVMTYETQNMTVCTVFMSPWFQKHKDFYSLFYYIFRSLFVQVFPCIIMFVSTCVLAYKIKHERILQRCHSKIGDGQKKDFQHRQRTTLMVVIIMVIFLIVEIPNGIVFGIRFYEEYSQKVVLEKHIDYPFAILHNFVLLLNYHCNFWIYVALSARFRNTLKNILCGEVKTMTRVFSLSRSQGSQESSSARNIKRHLENGNGTNHKARKYHR